jgi:hypothetical protein
MPASPPDSQEQAHVVGTSWREDYTGAALTMTIEICCSMCGRYKSIPVNKEKTAMNTTLQAVVEDSGWIAQQNGNNFDIYCSNRCAK